MNSLEIRQSRETIINYLNGLKMPTEVKRLVIKEILGQLESASEQEIIMEIKARDATKKAKEEKEEAKTDG